MVGDVSFRRVKLESKGGSVVALGKEVFVDKSSTSCAKPLCILKVSSTQQKDTLMMVGIRMLSSWGGFRLVDFCFRFLVNVMLLSFAFFNC